MSVEKIEKKPRKAAVKKTGEVEKVEKKAKAAPRAKAAKAEVPEGVVSEVAVTQVGVAITKVKQWPSHEEIALLAHRYYEQRGLQDGFHVQDWLQAEQDLLAAS